MPELYYSYPELLLVSQEETKVISTAGFPLEIISSMGNLSLVSKQDYADFPCFAREDKILVLTLENKEAYIAHLNLLDSLLPIIKNNRKALKLFCSFFKRELITEKGVFYDISRYENEDEEDIESKIEATEGEKETNFNKLIRDIARKPLPCVVLPELSPKVEEVIRDISSSNMGGYLCNDIYLTPFVKLIDGDYDIKVNKFLHSNHYTTLCSLEYTKVSSGAPITPEDHFIFTSDVMGKPQEYFEKRLEDFVGPFVKELDLSHAYITGSTMAYVFTLGNRDNLLLEDKYPVFYTVFNSEDRARLGTLPRLSGKYAVNLTDTKSGFLKDIEDNIIPFTIESGTDTDIAVDDSLSLEEFDALAQSYFEIISKYYPDTELIKIIKQNGDFYHYRVVPTSIQSLVSFRPVEIFQNKFSTIFTYHHGSVRACYTEAFGRKSFYMSASAYETYIGRCSKIYHYFASKKTCAQNIIMKYLFRGYGFTFNSEMERIILQYINSTVNLPYSYGLLDKNQNAKHCVYKYPYCMFVKYNVYNTIKAGM